MPQLELKNVTKRFGEFVAVKDINLSISPGEVVCLLGPSGCGKTTTLRMVAGLEEVSEGDISLADESVSHLSARHRNVAMAFQFYALYPNLSVEDNLKYPLHAEGLSESEKSEKVATISRHLQLDHSLSRYPHELSEGEKQRVAVGRCIIRQPNAFLFDEPLSRLDVSLRESMRADIKQILSALDRPTFVVTHDQVEAMTIGDRIVVMRDGQIEQVGTPQEVFDKPNNLFVASFIGTPQMNLIDVKIVDVSKTTCKVELSDGQNLTLNTDQLSSQPNLGESIKIGFRPRSAILGGEKTLPVPFEIEWSECMGAETLYHLTSGELGVRIVVPTMRPGAVQGDKVSINLNHQEILWFDKEGNRIRDKQEAKEN